MVIFVEFILKNKSDRKNFCWRHYISTCILLFFVILCMENRCISLTSLGTRCRAHVEQNNVCKLHNMYGIKKSISFSTSSSILFSLICVGINKNGTKCIHPKKDGLFCGIHK